jgi:antitoxin (DNA-binding transcriptional repressor) of toxin-antitoxin stability system
MKTLTVSEFEREVKSLLEAVRNGEHVILERLEIVPDANVTTDEKSAGNWSPAMLEILDNPNPDWALEPEPIPRRQSSSKRNVFGEESA